MKLLLDTHVFLWYISGDGKLARPLVDSIRAPANTVYLSAASVWECVVKSGLGKLHLPSGPGEYLPRQREMHGIAPLPIDEGSLRHLEGLPLLHRDPFDRMLVAQALQHDLTIVTLDEVVRGYPVPTLPHR